jgi:hypothetical protein
MRSYLKKFNTGKLNSVAGKYFLPFGKWSIFSKNNIDLYYKIW